MLWGSTNLVFGFRILEFSSDFRDDPMGDHTCYFESSTHRRTWKLPRCLFLLVGACVFACFFPLVVCCFHFEAFQVFGIILCMKIIE